MQLTTQQLATQQFANGLTDQHEQVFASQPDNPDMRESSSLWLFDDSGRFAFPRIGIEAEAHSWDNRMYTANFGLGGGRILREVGRGAAPSPFDHKSEPTILGAGPVSFQCLEPFRRWRVRYDGEAVDCTTQQQIEGTVDDSRRVAVSFDVELSMAAPAWVQDNSPDKVAEMSKAEAEEATSMGIGWRLEQVCRGAGTFTVDGKSRDFTAVGSRIKRQSIRPLVFFRGHCWQSALFPDGSAFGYIAYPPSKDGPEPYNEGYIYKDGVMHSARVSKAPWLRQLIEEGDDVSLELESALGTTRISGRTAFSSCHILETENGGFNLQQSGALYQWGDQKAYGMIERSATDEQMGG